MIKCQIRRQENQIKNICITGHAGYAEHGSDIVCSAVSMLSFAIANQLLIINKDFDVKITDNKFEFNIEDQKHDTQLLIDTLYNGLKMVEDQYKKYIKIKEV